MRVAWFTPLSRRSAIAEFSLWVADALSAFCDVVIWAPGTADARATNLEVVDFAAVPTITHMLPSYDLCFYNIGNHAGYHGAIYEVSRRYPGTVVLHDRVLHHFFFTHWFTDGRRDLYLRALERQYGAEARAAAEDSFAGIRQPLWEDDEAVTRFPLFEEALAGARGVVVHSAGQASTIDERWFGPVAPLFLPAYPPAEGTDEAVPTSFRADGRTTLVTVGHVNRNKQVHRVVEALAEAELRDRVRYLVIGPLDAGGPYGMELEAVIARHGLEETVELTGYLPDTAVGALLRSADVLVNLRYPAFEGGSASLMQGLALGKPTLVYETGSYAELPADAVRKVSPGDDLALSAALLELVTEPERRAAVGSAARQAASERTPEQYARSLLDFVEEMRYWEPALRLCDRVGCELAELGVPPEAAAVDLIAHETHTVLSDERPDPAEAALFMEIGPDDADSLERFLVRNDVPAVVGSFDPFPFTTSTARRIAFETRRDHYYGAFLGRRLIALSMLRGWDEGYDVPSFGIAVDADFHGRGLGTRMTTWTIEQARELGCRQVRLSVYGSNDTAYRIYERMGFRELERTEVDHAGSPDRRIVMTKELA